jgi:membrane protein
MLKWQYLLLKSKPGTWLIRKLKNSSPRGFNGTNLFDCLNFFRKEIFSPKFNDRASSVSFKFVMAIAPTLLLLFTLIPYIPIKNIDKTIYDIVKLATPSPKTQKTISDLLTNFYKHKKNTLLSFSILLTLFYSSNGMLGLMRQFNKSLPGFKKRNLVGRRGWAVALTLLLIFSVLLTATYFIFQSWAFNALNIRSIQKSAFFKLSSYGIILGFIFLTIGLIYRYGPSLKKRWPILTPGAVLATVLIVFSTFALNYVANNLINYSKIYGSVGFFILFFLWIFYNAQIMLIGFELNVSIMVNRALEAERNSLFDEDGDDDEESEDGED